MCVAGVSEQCGVWKPPPARVVLRVIRTSESVKKSNPPRGAKAKEAKVEPERAVVSNEAWSPRKNFLHRVVKSWVTDVSIKISLITYHMGNKG
jgi:hypothetical protein